MAATGTCTVSTWITQGLRGMTFTFESDSGGTVTEVTCLTNVTGILKSSLVYPSQASGYVPDSGFDAYIFNADSFDLLNGQGENITDAPQNWAKVLSYPNSSQVLLVNETMRLHIENCGNNRRGYVIVTLE